MDLSNLEKVLAKEPKYRLNQARSAVFQQLIEDWSEAVVFPLELREKLNKECSLLIKAEMIFSRKEEAIKARGSLQDGLQVESILMRHVGARNTVCVSSQVGCPLGCKFCATGEMGFKRNLQSMEIVEQVIFFARHLKKKEARVTNVVFMGMGEPFLNYDNVIEAIRILNDKNGLNISARKISISTVGIVSGIKKIAKEGLQINLAVSLHAPTDKLRSELIPSNEKYSIKNILETVDDYIKKTKRVVMFEYLLIGGVNDSDDCASSLARIMKHPLYFLNLILYNPTGSFQSSSSQRVKIFKEILKKRGIKFSQRYRFGGDIQAACGQFIVKPSRF